MKKFSKILSLFSITLLMSVFSLTSCTGKNADSKSSSTSQIVPIETISFRLEKTSILIGETTKILDIQIKPNNATNRDIAFKSDDTSIAEVDSNVVRGVGAGSTFIIGYSINYPNVIFKVKIDIVKKSIPVNEITLELPQDEIEIGETMTPIVNVLPDDATNKDYELITSSTEIVSIENNSIKGLKAGFVRIQAKSKSNDIISNSVYFEVKEITAKGINVQCNKTSLLVGETTNLTYSLIPEDVKDKQVGFKTLSDKTDIIEVSQTGVVTAKGVGEDYAVVFMKNKPEVWNKIKISVSEVLVSNINLSAEKTTLGVTEEIQLSVEVLPLNATFKAVQYTTKSGTNNIISVSKNGVVTGISVGKDSVICKSVSNPSVSDEIEFEIIEVETQTIEIEETSVSMLSSSTYQINAQVVPSYAINKELSYKVLDRNSYVDKGERFEASTNYSYDIDQPFLLNEKINIDIWFDQGNTQKISLMLGQGWNQYFGYYDLFSDGTLGDKYDGVTVSEPIEGMFRFTFDLSLLNLQSDKPMPNEYIDLIHIKGLTSVASGSIKVNPEIKLDILSVNSTGLVNAFNLGEQTVRVYCTKQSAIYKDVVFNITSNPNDPIGEDVYEMF